MSILNKVALGGFLCLVLSLALGSPQHALAYANTPPINADYNHKIIDDLVFSNTGSMSPQDIQNFLNSKVPVCDTNHQGGLQQYPPPYTCLKDYVDPTTGKRAAQLIYDEAQNKGVNPQVILATLQKEQSLITDTWPYPVQYRSAMGYGCPESQTVCDSQYYGFYNQVRLGTTLLKVGLDRNCGNNNSFPGWYVNPKWAKGNSPDVDGVATRLDNCATGSFYNYTPHRPDSAYTQRNGVYYYGNYNFINFYTNWFGSTWYSGPTFAHPDGTLIRAVSEPTVYYISGGTRRSMTSLPVFFSYGFHPRDVKLATPGDNALPIGQPLNFREGAIVQGSSPTVYIIDYDAGGQIQKRSLDSIQNFERLGYNFGEVIRATDAELPSVIGPSVGSTTIHPDGTLVKAQDNPTVYVVSSGKKHSLTSLAVFLSYRYKFNNVKPATAQDMALPDGPSALYNDGTLIKGWQATVYITRVVGGVVQKRSLVSPFIFFGLGYSFNDVLLVGGSDLPSTNGPNVGQ